MNIDELPTQLRAFLDEHAGRGADADGAGPTTSIERARAFQHRLSAAGLAGLTWPKQFGGAGLPPEAQQVFQAVAADYELPTSELTLSLNVCGPAVLQFGSNDQRSCHLPATLRGERVWCQLWSEPEAGSDLAAVRTRAIPHPDGGWLVQGQKIWTSGAHYADFGLLLCRTDPAAAKHRGLSMLIVDLRLPGITIRPLRQMTGDAHFNEVFLDDVHVPAEALLGELGQGWPITTWMMGRERVFVGLGMRNENTLDWDDLRDVAQSSGRLAEPAVRHRLAQLHIRQRAAELLSLRLAQETEHGSGRPLLGSAVKIVEAAVIREGAELAVELAAVRATAWDPDSQDDGQLAAAVLMSPAFAIGGGTDEIQLNTLGERFLKLPAEPKTG